VSVSARPGYRATPPTQTLLALYSNPARAASMSPGEWSTVLGSARRSRSLGHLGLRLAHAGVLRDVEPRVLGHFESAAMVVRRQRQRLRWELYELADALRDLDAPVVLLKGAAYEAQGLAVARARLAADVDVLVPRSQLAEAEARLLTQGWQSVELSDYDERYYREWSHEIPALTHPARGMEVDVHHSIGPALPGESVAVGSLFERSREVAWQAREGGSPVTRFRVLQPIDQLVHVAIHTYGSSDLALRLREVMDFDLLFRGYCASREGGAESHAFDSAALVERAAEMGQARAMWWTLHYAQRWLGTPIDPALLSRQGRPAAATVAMMDWLSDRSMLPGASQRRTGAEFAAEIGLLTRYQWQRLPLRRLVPHVLEKVRRRLLGRDAAHA
jgi:hypothetical protein